MNKIFLAVLAIFIAALIALSVWIIFL